MTRPDDFWITADPVADEHAPTTEECSDFLDWLRERLRVQTVDAEEWQTQGTADLARLQVATVRCDSG